MVDRDRVLAKLDELDGYLDELRTITPRNLEEYARIEKKRSCERLLHDRDAPAHERDAKHPRA